jgi:hypothetical protein
MKQRVLSKMASFHTLFTVKKKDPNNVFLNGTMGFLLPLDMRSREEEDFSSSVTVISLFKKTSTPF